MRTLRIEACAEEAAMLSTGCVPDAESEEGNSRAIDGPDACGQPWLRPAPSTWLHDSEIEV